MKKARLILTAFAVVAVAGGAFAVKSKVISDAVFYTTLEPNQPGSPLEHAITTNAANGTQYWYTLAPNTPATTQAFITTDAD